MAGFNTRSAQAGGADRAALCPSLLSQWWLLSAWVLTAVPKGFLHCPSALVQRYAGDGDSRHPVRVLFDAAVAAVSPPARVLLPLASLVWSARTVMLTVLIFLDPKLGFFGTIIEEHKHMTRAQPRFRSGSAARPLLQIAVPRPHRPGVKLLPHCNAQLLPSKFAWSPFGRSSSSACCGPARLMMPAGQLSS